MSKRYGVLGTKLHNLKRKYNLIVQLAPKEIWKLILEGIITLGAMILIYLGFLFLFSKMLYPNDSATLGYVWRLMGITEQKIQIVRHIFTLAMIIITVWFTYWRLSRRYWQIELQHVLMELEYIASGHYDHRISEDLVGRLSSVVSSINKLVDSTTRAMAEERIVEQAKNELITNVSHDIRTPLTSVIGYLGLIEEEAYDNADELKQYVHIAYTKAQQMKRLADDLFEYTKMTSAEMNLHQQKVSVSRFLTQIAAEYDTLVKENQLHISVDMSKDYFIFVDAQALARVYDNIINNAVKYSHGTHIVLRADQHGDNIHLAISNDGIPIEQQALGQLFTRFYRADMSRNSGVEGSGLGLAIAQSIVHAHNGELMVNSNETETVFTIVLEKCHD
ncbi:HAMP domain-containing histidine kinase [Carnobacteriaceae bacterium zg-ZUI252]|nr:HAMP domain-containing histidine kinase [Carnobacteriaceae bacterium zg-ZUI252]MBS4770486.1 HAMP domain-containing histidine kinase [Carnobacteriaceae bacterium zg-ZUI240]